MTNLLYSAKHYQIKCAKSEEICKEYAETLQNLLPNQEDNAGKFLTTDGTNPSWQEVNLTNKANNDLSNVANISQNFKEQSVSWGMPDYNAGIDIASTLLNSASYTAPYDCYIHFSTYGNVGIRFKIGDNYVIYLDGEVNIFISEGIYLEKGETLIKDSFQSGAMAVLFPLKGVN